MVTHDVVAIPKMKKIKIKKIKNKKAKKKKHKKGSEKQESESDADNLDLNQKLYPLLHYVSDQEELVSQMFATIRGSKLEAMLPPVLKGIPLKELKKLCLHELRGMSKKRILCCINGQVMEGSSGSEEDDEEEKEEKEKATNEGAKNEENNNKGDKRKLSSDQIPKDFLQKKIKVEPGLEDSKEGGLGSDTGKSVLELLELEMRARIIKTMLEKGDDGKKIAEDAIAAVMQSAKQITKEDNQMRSEKETAAKAESKNAVVAELKGDLQLKITEEQVTSETGRGDKSTGSKDGKSSHKHHRSRDSDTRKETRRKVRDKREKSYSDDSNCGEHKKRSKEGTNLERQVQKKKKITRKEFEERMKRAKKNRTYRQRKTSEDEEKAKDKEKQKHQADEPNKDQGNDLESKKNYDLESKKEDAAPEEGEAVENKPTEEVSGEVSEKEEGELDSNEEEEGACTPSNISSASNYSSSSPSSRRRSYSSRSRSRSYSRSLSRSPSSRRRKRRWRRRSYTRSRSRSRSVDWKNRDEGKRSYERKSREQIRNDNIGKKGNVKVPLGNQKQNKEEEENWGQKCDIEFVDSEEDFDDHPDTAKKDMLDKKLAPAAKGQMMERASISFSLQKKSAPNITPSIDLDDLPLKQSQLSSNVIGNLSSDIGIIKTLKPTKEEEIVISSDSEREMQEKVPVTVTSSRRKKILPDTKQADPKQTVPPLSKEETTESQVEVIKILADPEHEIDNSVSECHTERQGQSIRSNEHLKKLNSERAVEQIDRTRKDETPKQDKIKDAMEKNEDVTNSTCPTAVKESEIGNVDNIERVKGEMGKRDSLAFNAHKQNYIDVEELSQSDDNDIMKSQQSDDKNIEKLQLNDDIDVERPQQSDDSGIKKPQQSDDSGIKKPQQSDDSGIKKPQQSDDSDIKKPQQSDDSGIDKPQQSDDSGIKKPQQSDDGVKKPQQSDDSGVKKPQQSDDSGIKKPQQSDDSGIKKPQQSDDSGIKKPEQSDDSGIKKPEQSDDSVKKPQQNDDSGVKKPEQSDNSGVKKPQQSDDSGVKKPQQSDDSGVKKPQQSDDSGVKKPQQSDDSGIKKPHQSDDSGVKKPQQSDDSGVKKPQQSDDSGVKKPHQSDDSGVKKPQQSDDSGVKKPEQSDGNDEQNNTSGLQLPVISFSQLSVSEKEEMKDSDHNIGKLDDPQTMKEDCFVIENKPQKEIGHMGSECCRSVTEAELTCNTCRLISKEVGNHLERKDHISVEDLKGSSKEVIPVLSERNSQDKNDSPCKDLCIIEGIKGEIKTKDPTESFQEGMSLKVKERSVESTEKEMVQNKQLTHAQEHEEETREQMLNTDSLTEDCTERAKKVMEIDNKKVMEIDKNDSVATEECLLREKKIMVSTEEQKFQERSADIEDKHVSSVVKEEPTEDFYRGAEHLTFSDDDRDDDCNIEEFIRGDSPVEPIRIETGLIRKSVLRQRKMEMVMPDKSWMKKEKKKKEKSKDTLVIEGIGLLTSTLSESAQGSSLKESEGETLTIDKPNARMETGYANIASASETDSSLQAEDMTHNSSTIQSPKYGLEQETNVPAPEETVNYEDYEPKPDEKLQKRTSQETEIIGVIETSKDSGSDNFDDFELEGSSWSMRWLQSEKVQKVVTSSKMLSRVRKKIQKKDKATKVVTTEKVEEPQKKIAEPLVPIIGSIEEYERLFGMKVKKDKDEASNSSSTSLQGTVVPGEQSGHSSTAPEKVPGSGTAAPIFGSDDEGEDSEEEALWSKILGK